jgi:fibrillarin-like rRNA methylase
MLCLKARSIDATQAPQAIFAHARPELEKTFKILQEIDLTPFDKDHLFYNLEKK